MAYSFTSLNTSSKKTIKEGINTDDMKFAPLKDYVGKTLKVDGFFFTTGGKWGKQVVVIAEGAKINMPKRCTEQFEQIRDNDETLNAMLEGHLCITNIEKFAAKDGNTVIFDFGDC